MTERLLRAGFWLALLFITYSAFAPPDLVRAPRLGDTLLHVLAFLLLANLLLMAYLPRRALLATGLLLAYAILIECVQLGLPDRSGELKDLFFSGVGVALGLVSYLWLGQRLATVLGRWLH